MNRHSASRKKDIGAVLTPSVAVVAIMLLATMPSSKALPGNPTNESLSAQVASSIRACSREKSSAVVRIRCTDGHGEINGTGFYIDPNGTLCTLAEIVRDVDGITILQNGSEHSATVMAIDPRSGVAFLKTQATNTPGDTSLFLNPDTLTNAPAETPVMAIGFPRDGKANTVLGMITGVETHVGEHYFCVPHLVASIPLTPGEGGSPVLDLSGELLGMVISGDTQLGRCRIIPAAAIEKLHHDLLCYGRLNPGWIGAVVEEAAVPAGNSRTRIASVQQGSPAESAGLLPGDMILSFAGHPIINPDEIPGISFYLTAGESVEMTIMRGKKIRKIKMQCVMAPQILGDVSPGSSTVLGQALQRS